MTKEEHGNGQHTPWGGSQTKRVYPNGITWHSTAGHGGFFVPKKVRDAWPEPFKSWIPFAGAGWYEEDCDWCVPYLMSSPTFEQDDDHQKHLEAAESTLRNWQPDLWEAWQGRELQPGESHTKDSLTWYAANKDRIISIAAYGSWADWVPEGSVGLAACVGGRHPQTRNFCGPMTYWLVPAEDYKRRGRDGFIVDPERHTQIQGNPTVRTA